MRGTATRTPTGLAGFDDIIGSWSLRAGPTDPGAAAVPRCRIVGGLSDRRAVVRMLDAGTGRSKP